MKQCWTFLYLHCMQAMLYLAMSFVLSSSSSSSSESEVESELSSLDPLLTEYNKHINHKFHSCPIYHLTYYNTKHKKNMKNKYITQLQEIPNLRWFCLLPCCGVLTWRASDAVNGKDSKTSINWKIYRHSNACTDINVRLNCKENEVVLYDPRKDNRR